MTDVLLTKIEVLYPELRRYVEIYKSSRSQTVKQAIASGVLRANTSQLLESEVLYLAWIKAGADQQAREASESLRAKAAAKASVRRKG